MNKGLGTCGKRQLNYDIIMEFRCLLQHTGLLLIMANGTNSRLLTASIFISLQVKIPVSALCSYAQTNISPYLDWARLRQKQIEIFIWAYLHTAYGEIQH